MTFPKVFLALTSVLLLQNPCALSEYVDIDFSTFDNAKCGAENRWTSVDLELPLVSTTSVLKSSSFSCASLQIDVSPGTLEISVYLKIESDSRIEVIIRDKDETIENYVYSKNNVEFEQGWHTIILLIDKETAVYVTLLGFSQNEDMVVIQSVKYNNNTLGDSKYEWDFKQGETKIIDLLSNNDDKHQGNNVQEFIENSIEEFSSYESLEIIQHNDIYPFFYDYDNDYNEDIQNNDIRANIEDNHNKILSKNIINIVKRVQNNDVLIREGGETTTTEFVSMTTSNNESTISTTENDEGANTTDLSTTDATTTKEPTSSTTNENESTTPTTTEQNNGGEETTSDGPTVEPSTDNSRPSWNIWTIVLVSVASVSLVGIVIISAYFLGKNSRRESAPPIDLSDLEAPRIIPRARSNRLPYQRFGSDYGGSSFERDDRDL